MIGHRSAALSTTKYFWWELRGQVEFERDEAIRQLKGSAYAELIIITKENIMPTSDLTFYLAAERTIPVIWNNRDQRTREIITYHSKMESNSSGAWCRTSFDERRRHRDNTRASAIQGWNYNRQTQQGDILCNWYLRCLEISQSTLLSFALAESLPKFVSIQQLERQTIEDSIV